MQLCKYYPIANDRMGAIWTLASIKGACVIEFGPAELLIMQLKELEV